MRNQVICRYTLVLPGLSSTIVPAPSLSLRVPLCPRPLRRAGAARSPLTRAPAADLPPPPPPYPRVVSFLASETLDDTLRYEMAIALGSSSPRLFLPRSGVLFQRAASPSVLSVLHAIRSRAPPPPPLHPFCSGAPRSPRSLANQRSFLLSACRVYLRISRRLRCALSCSPFQPPELTTF